jgi:SAM-dependent methyltransferase
MTAPANPLATAEPWDLVAADYTADLLQHFDVFARVAIQRAALPPAARVADVAAGPGTVTVQVAAAGARVSAIDISASMLAQLRRRASEVGVVDRIEVHQGDAQKLPFESGAYDAAFSMFGLMFFPDRHAGLVEMKRVLKPGGRAVISSWVPFAGPFGTLMEAVKEHVPDLPSSGGRLPLGAPEELTAELGAAGFRDVRVEVVPHPIRFGSFEEFWDSLSRTNAPCVLLQRRLGERWSAVAPQVRARVRATLGDGEIVTGTGAYVAVGVA